MTRYFAMLVLAIGMMAAAGTAQTRSVRDMATAYGARLNARGEPANLNPNRINSRSDNRVSNRLALRLERYRPESSDPVAGFAAATDDRSRRAPAITPPPPADTD